MPCPLPGLTGSASAFSSSIFPPSLELFRQLFSRKTICDTTTHLYLYSPIGSPFLYKYSRIHTSPLRGSRPRTCPNFRHLRVLHSRAAACTRGLLNNPSKSLCQALSCLAKLFFSMSDSDSSLHLRRRGTQFQCLRPLPSLSALPTPSLLLLPRTATSPPPWPP